MVALGSGNNTPYVENQIVAHRVGVSRLDYQHATIYRFMESSALYRSDVCGRGRLVMVHTGYAAGDCSWFPADDGASDVAADLVRRARQGYKVCKRCLEWAKRNTSEVI